MGKPQNKKGGKKSPGGTPNSKPNTPQMKTAGALKKAGKQVPTPKSEPFKKLAKNELSSDEMDSSSNSFDEDFEALLKGPAKQAKSEEKIPKLVPAKENGQKTPKQNDKAKQSPKAVTPGKAAADKKTPGKQAAESKTPGKPTPVKVTPGKAAAVGKQTPGKTTPGKKEAGQKTPEAKTSGIVGSAQKKTPVPAATSAVKDKQQKRKRDDSSDDDEEVMVSTKLAKTSNTPEKAAHQVVSTPEKTKAASPAKLAGAKSKTPEKKANKKRQHDDESDEEEEINEENQAKKLKAEIEDGKGKSANNASDDIAAVAAQDHKFKAEVDKRVLFIKNFTRDVTEQDVKALSKDIEEVQLRIIYSKKIDNQSYAFLHFKDEKTADANLKLLSTKKLNNSQIVVDYIGEKSKNRRHLIAKPLSVEEIDPLRLYIRGINKTTTEADLQKLFPAALSVAIPMKKKDSTPIGYAFAAFKTPEECKAAHDSMQGKVIDGKVLVVLFAKKCSQKKDVPAVLQPAKVKAAAKPEKPVAVIKGTKPAKKQEEKDDEDDEEDEDDDDEEDDDSDDDDEDDDSDDDDESNDDEDESDDDDEDDDNESEDDDDE